MCDGPETPIRITYVDCIRDARRRIPTENERAYKRTHIQSKTSTYHHETQKGQEGNQLLLCPSVPISDGGRKSH